MQGERKGWGLGGGVENTGEVVSARVLVLESKLWQLIDLSGKDKGRANKVCRGFKSQCLGG